MNSFDFTRTLAERGDKALMVSTCERCGFEFQSRVIHGAAHLEEKESQHAKECNGDHQHTLMLASC
jgi:predicted Zn-ribbon and HTH transcriptional regulator